MKEERSKPYLQADQLWSFCVCRKDRRKGHRQINLRKGRNVVPPGGSNDSDFLKCRAVYLN